MTFYCQGCGQVHGIDELIDEIRGANAGSIALDQTVSSIFKSYHRWATRATEHALSLVPDRSVDGVLLCVGLFRGDCWECHIWPNDELEKKQVTRAKTAPLAICAALLQAKKVGLL